MTDYLTGKGRLKMNKLHYKQKLKYLNAVANHLIECGYHVEEPTHEHDLLDVWGTSGGRKCFVEVCVTMYRCDGGINGIWDLPSDDENCEGREMFLSDDETYGLDTRWSIEGLIADQIKPFKRGKRK
jgi:hypothetical protein